MSKWWAGSKDFTREGGYRVGNAGSPEPTTFGSNYVYYMHKNNPYNKVILLFSPHSKIMDSPQWWKDFL